MLGVAVTLVHRRVGREAVHVAVALDVPNPDALPAREHHVERFVIARAIGVFERDVILGVHGILLVAPRPRFRQRIGQSAPLHEGLFLGTPVGPIHRGHRLGEGRDRNPSFQNADDVDIISSRDHVGHELLRGTGAEPAALDAVEGGGHAAALEGSPKPAAARRRRHQTPHP